jgi:very-short-patch-repair endonuclease
MRILITEQQLDTLTDTLKPKREDWNKERLMNLVKDNPKYLDIEGNPYDYSLIQYDINDRIKVRNEIPIVCHAKYDYGDKEGQEHGEFPKILRTWIVHPTASCPQCLAQKMRNNFIEKSRESHLDPDKYDYTMVDFTDPRYIVPGRERDGHRRFSIFCKTHNEFFTQDANVHKRGGGCPPCAESKGEAVVAKYLDSKGINYERYKRFVGLKNVYPLEYDFYLPDYKMLIEFDGELHFEPSNHTNGEAKFKTQQINDRIKDSYVMNNPDIVRLIRVFVKTDTEKIKNIPDILNKLIYMKTNDKIVYNSDYPKLQ